MNRVVGLETEYGCLTNEPAGSASVVSQVRNWIFENNRYGLADVHQRDWDEPAGNGGFLFNGGRAYVDMGHLEVCTPECLGLRDLVVFDRAGDVLLLNALQALGIDQHVGFIRNNIDHYSGATFGCHENYLVRRSAPLTETNVLSLLAFLTLRVLYTGAGRVGALQHGMPAAEGGLDGGSLVRFQMSQRADYINNDLFEWVQFNRAIINTRDEPLADGRRYRRLHLLHGDTNVLPGSLYLKVGTTALVLDLLEINQLPKVAVADAVHTFRRLSICPDGPWLVPLSDGRSASALEVLRRYLDAAEVHFRGRDEETNSILDAWTETLDGLLIDSSRLLGRVDWITKYWMFQEFIDREGVSWEDPILKSLDLEYHQLDPGRCLGLAVQDGGALWTPGKDETEAAMTKPPADTRAFVRSEVMRQLSQMRNRYFVDWEVLDAEGMPSLHLLNPFEVHSESTAKWMEDLRVLSRQRQE